MRFKSQPLTVGLAAAAIASAMLVVGATTSVGSIVRLPGGPHQMAASQIQPLPGQYEYASVLVSQSGCGLRPGLKQQHIFYYPGPNSTGARYVSQGIRNEILYSTYPTTPAAGITTWSGTFYQYKAPGGQYASGTFTATFTLLDPDFFLGAETDVQGSCTQNWQASYIRLGSP